MSEYFFKFCPGWNQCSRKTQLCRGIEVALRVIEKQRFGWGYAEVRDGIFKYFALWLVAAGEE